MEQDDDAIYGETFQVLFLWGRRRSYPRYPLNAPVAFAIEEKAEAERAEGRDISLGGVGVLPETDESMPQVGSHVRLRIIVEGIDRLINLEGEVVHADEQNGFGVRFENLPTSLRQRLKLLLMKKASDG